MEEAHLQGLNPPQHQAVTTVEGPLLILAGAGSGKTRVLTRRIAHLVHLGVRPYNILAVTFTNKAAAEMKRRVQELLGQDLRHLLVSTFHSACARFLRRDAPLLGYSNSFVIYDDDDQKRLMKGILGEMKLDAGHYGPNDYLHEIDRAKNQLLRPTDTLEVRNPGQPLSEVWKRYDAAMHAANAMDFNDLIGLMVRLLEERPELRAEYQERFRYIMVDEYQDTNHAQYRLVRALTGPQENLAVVGDDDQSIYSFRGADIQNILSFEKDYPQAVVVRLEQNYRSSARILSAAGAIIARNRARKEKNLWTEALEGEPIRRIHARDADGEANEIAREILDLQRKGYKPSDFAVILRTNSGTLPIENALSSYLIRYVVVGGKKFYQRREIRDMVAYLRLLINPTDDQAFLRIVNVPRRKIGEKALERLREVAQEHGLPLLDAARIVAREDSRITRPFASFVYLVDMLTSDLNSLPLDQLVLKLARESGYRRELQAEDEKENTERVANIDALAREAHLSNEAARSESEMTPVEIYQAFLDRVSLAGQDEELPNDQGVVTLLTAHLAKGLEYKVVFVSGMLEGLFPHARSFVLAKDIEEERRLVYVAFTRARERLYFGTYEEQLIPTEGRMQRRPAQPSRFLRDLPRDVLVGPVVPPPPAPAPRPSSPFGTYARQQAPRAPSPAPSAPAQGTCVVPDDPAMFVVGAQIRDRVWGRGTILEVGAPQENPRLLVLFDRFGRRSFKASERRLEILLGG